MSKAQVSDGRTSPRTKAFFPPSVPGTLFPSDIFVSHTIPSRGAHFFFSSFSSSILVLALPTAEQVARESVLKFRPNAKIVAHHGNVKESRFDVDFLRRFDVVLNGLDNLEVRFPGGVLFFLICWRGGEMVVSNHPVGTTNNPASTFHLSRGRRDSTVQSTNVRTGMPTVSPQRDAPGIDTPSPQEHLATAPQPSTHRRTSAPRPLFFPLTGAKARQSSVSGGGDPAGRERHHGLPGWGPGHGRVCTTRTYT